MKIGLIGSGGREHALALALTRNPQRDSLFVFGSSANPGILPLAEKYQIGRLSDGDGIYRFMLEQAVDLVVVGPEAPLMYGLVDRFRAAGVSAVGPTQAQAQLEGNKGFMRELLQRHLTGGSPEWAVVGDVAAAEVFIRRVGEVAVKPLGLTGGKGVRVMGIHLNGLDEALQDVASLLQKDGSVLLEERLIGEEFSRMVFTADGVVAPMPVAQDFKYAYDGDQGNMTGGMGAYTHADGGMPFLTAGDLQQADEILRQVIQAVGRETGAAYRGFLYGQFIATAKGVRVIEFNVRLGDPEGINLMLLLESDAPTLLLELAQGRLAPDQVRFARRASVVKYLVPAGYPDADAGPANFELDQEAVERAGFRLICASVDRSDGLWRTLGSRTLALAGLGEDPGTLSQQLETMLSAIEPGVLRHRKDVGSAQTIDAKVRRMRELRGEGVG